jgi:hypothetical protein
MLIYENFQSIHNLCKDYSILDYTINQDVSISSPESILDRLNEFLLAIGKNPVDYVEAYKILD